MIETLSGCLVNLEADATVEGSVLQSFTEQIQEPQPALMVLYTEVINIVFRT